MQMNIEHTLGCDRKAIAFWIWSSLRGAGSESAAGVPGPGLESDE